MIPTEIQVAELQKIYDPMKLVVDKVFRGQVSLEMQPTVTGSDPCIHVPQCGISVTVVEIRSAGIAGHGQLPVYQLTQEIPIPATRDDPPDVDIDEIGDYIHWRELLHRLCSVVAACLVTQALDEIAAEEARREWQLEMDQFYEQRIVGHAAT